MLTEFIVNLHMHTYYSDGHGHHSDLLDAAFKAEVDAIIVTDHNVWVNGPEDYYQRNGRRVLMLVGEEIHDQARDPQKIICWSLAPGANWLPWRPNRSA